MIQVETKCKFCGKPITISGDEECPNDKWKLWVDMVACNRCADFRMKIATLRDWVRKIAAWWDRMVLTNRGKEAHDKAVEALEKATKEISETLGDHYRLTTIWDKEFVTQIMEKPKLAEVIVRNFCGMVRDEARRQWKQERGG